MKHEEAFALIADALTRIGTRLGDTDVLALAHQLDALIAADQPRPPRLRKIDARKTDLTLRYGYWDESVHDGNVCAGCGGWNNYGHGGYLGDLCYTCDDEERRQMAAMEVEASQ